MKKKIFKNIIPVIKAYWVLREIRPLQLKIRKAKAEENYDQEREYISKCCVTWANRVLGIIETEVNVTGKENLPKEGPVVFVANHQGYVDIPVCAANLDTIQMAFVAKSDLGNIPLYSRWMEDIRCVFIKRENPRESLKAIKEGISLIEQGFSLLIFPEGTRSRSSQMAHFKRGSLKLATKTGVPVVPITINGTYRSFEEQGYFRPAKVDLVIHKPIETKDMDKQQQQEITDVVENIVRSSLEELMNRKN